MQRSQGVDDTSALLNDTSALFQAGGRRTLLSSGENGARDEEQQCGETTVLTMVNGDCDGDSDVSKCDAEIEEGEGRAGAEAASGSDAMRDREGSV
mmetsp:Transcript_24347/g.60530  ORF Transcript_24347/g.60530 Transcript_24347/m.60530 type:complete len:96 (+) Transcript_24347:1894-2181(+)